MFLRGIEPLLPQFNALFPMPVRVLRAPNFALDVGQPFFDGAKPLIGVIAWL
jgi:hypothetical protein